MAEEKQGKAEASAPREQKKRGKDDKATPVKQKRDDMRGATSIVRVAGKDVNGALSVERALDEVRGIGSSMAHAIAFGIETKLSIARSTPIGSLSEKQIEDIEHVVSDPAGAGAPGYFLNRNGDTENGKDMHMTGNDLIFAVRQDITRDVGARTWRGMRHQYGQRVRGQHTRSSGRTGATVGVTKKSAQKTQSKDSGKAPAKK